MTSGVPAQGDDVTLNDATFTGRLVSIDFDAQPDCLARLTFWTDDDVRFRLGAEFRISPFAGDDESERLREENENLRARVAMTRLLCRCQPPTCTERAEALTALAAEQEKREALEARLQGEAVSLDGLAKELGWIHPHVDSAYRLAARTIRAALSGDTGGEGADLAAEIASYGTSGNLQVDNRPRCEHGMTMPHVDKSFLPSATINCPGPVGDTGGEE